MNETLDKISDDPTIGNEQVFWRRVHATDVVPDENLGRKRSSSASFLQDGPDGDVSVYLASEAQSPQAVMQSGKESYLVSLTVGFVRALGLGIARDPSSGGPGHALLIGHKTRGMCSKMAKAATWVLPYCP